MYETSSGQLVSSSVDKLQKEEAETLLESTFSQTYPHIMFSRHTDNRILIWNMQKMAKVAQIQIESNPFIIISNESNLLLVIDTEDNIYGYQHTLDEDDTLIISKQFKSLCVKKVVSTAGEISEQQTNLSCAVLLPGTQFLLLAGITFIQLFDLQSRATLWKKILNFPDGCELVNLVSPANILTGNDVILIGLSCKTQKINVFIYEYPREELEIAEENKGEMETHVEQEVKQEKDLVDNYLQKEEIKAPKKKWGCSSDLHAEEIVEPRANSILIASNIQIKEKSIYDVDSKEIAKAKKKGGPNLLVSINITIYIFK